MEQVATRTLEDYKMAKTIKDCCGCGFSCVMLKAYNCVVDNKGNLEQQEEVGILSDDKPRGPFTCLNCGTSYKVLPILK